MSECVFCKIVSGSVSTHLVCENAHYCAFLDINPMTRGHTLVIPKKHARWVYDVEDFGGYWKYVHKVTHILNKALRPTWINYFTYGEIPHAHIHILPRYTKLNKTTPILPSDKKTSATELSQIAKIISKHTK